jgi:hypothetical protein
MPSCILMPSGVLSWASIVVDASVGFSSRVWLLAPISDGTGVE